MRARGAMVCAVLALGCSRTADEEQCKKLVDKLVDLLADSSSQDHIDKVKKDVKNDKRSAIISKETCIGKISRSQYECMMAAKSVEQYTACEK